MGDGAGLKELKMRPIKFRAWNKNAKIMVDLKKITHLALSEGLQGGIYIPELDDFEVMQFTGLHDKNGTPVYEGDIVSDHVGIGSVEYADDFAGFRVNYHDSRAKWFYDYSLRGEMESIEVIGNIYESPELLK